MTSARIVTLGQAMAMIPTMMARTPSRINEVDDDLSTDAGFGADADVDINGFLSSGLGACPRLSASGVETMVTGEAAPASIAGLAQARKVRAHQPVSQ